jgi:hypothetical protein
MNKYKQLKELATVIDKAYMRKHGKKAVYTVIEKRVVPAELRPNIGEKREGGYDVTGERMSYEVNQYKRLKRAYKKNVASGVIHYLKKQGFKPDEELIHQTL